MYHLFGKTHAGKEVKPSNSGKFVKKKVYNTQGPAYNEFGYNEHPDTKSK